jgi:hypothetical protein
LLLKRSDLKSRIPGAHAPCYLKKSWKPLPAAGAEALAATFRTSGAIISATPDPTSQSARTCAGNAVNIGIRRED